MTMESIHSPNASWPTLSQGPVQEGVLNPIPASSSIGTDAFGQACATYHTYLTLGLCPASYLGTLAANLYSHKIA